MVRKIVVGLLAGLAVLIVGALAYLFVLLPRDIPVPAVSIEVTPERVARGEYLANHVLACTYCHSRRDWRYFSGPVIDEFRGAGGEVFDRSVGFPGRLVSGNITPAAVGDWSDGELLRAITGGLSRDGTPLFPVMPYDAYRRLTTEDAYAVIAYLRTLPPVAGGPAGERELGFPLNLIVRTIPAPAEPASIDPADTAAYGEYLATLGGCTFCHTPRDERQQAIRAMRLGGGYAMPVQGVMVPSANISADRETGIGDWSRERFIARFRAYAGPEGRRLDPATVGYNTGMPWTLYAGMTDADLGAIYAFLMQSPPVRNRVTPIDEGAVAPSAEAT